MCGLVCEGVWGLPPKLAAGFAHTQMFTYKALKSPGVQQR